MELRDYTELVFESGSVLSAQMLNEIYRYPREFLHVFCRNFVDGIITGFDFEDHTDGVYVTPGIVKIKERYYILPQSMNVDELLKRNVSSINQSQVYFLCLVCDDVWNPDDSLAGISARSRLIFRLETEKPADSILLGKYKFRPDVGMKLPSLNLNSEGDPFAEFTQASFLQLIDTDYAHPQGGITYHPLIFRAIRSYLEQKFPISPYDFSLLSAIQNHGIVSRVAVETYVAVNKGTSHVSTQMTKEQLFQELIECIQIPYKPMVYKDLNLAQKSVSTRERYRSKLI